jgi:hypothetical protein
MDNFVEDEEGECYYTPSCSPSGGAQPPPPTPQAEAEAEALGIDSGGNAAVVAALAELEADIAADNALKEVCCIVVYNAWSYCSISYSSLFLFFAGICLAKFC